MMKKKIFDDSLIDKVFPHKDSEGNPLYRKGQREAIKASIDAFNNGYKYVAIDGKTGCGKSVINYTVARCCTEDNVVYLTPLKQLQDQIGSEGWDEMAVLKGKSGYPCNYCQDIDDISVRSNYEGDDILMCNNSSPESKVSKDLDKLRKSVCEHHEYLKGDRLLKYKSSFSNMKEYDEVINYLKRKFTKSIQYQLSLDDEDPLKLKKYVGVPNTMLDKLVTEEVYDRVGCNMKQCECPHISAKNMTYVRKINVLNPDLMYYLKKYDEKYSNINLLIIDEAHGFEDIIQRVFSSSIPIDFIKEAYGIDIRSIITGDNTVDKFKWSKLIAIENTLSILRRFSSIMMIHNSISKINLCTSKGKIASMYKASKNFVPRSGSVSPMNEIISMICFDSDGALKPIVDNYKDIGSEYNSLDSVIKSIRKYLLPYMIDIRVKRLNEFSLNYEQASETTISEEYIIFEYLVLLHNLIKDFVINTSSLMSDVEKVDFIFHETDGKLYDFIPKRMRVVINSRITVMSSVIVSPGNLANKHYYDSSDYVLLSTGTWVYYDSMLKSLGLKKEDVFFYSIPSTFEIKRRPAFITYNSIQNFSKKNEIGAYVYDTEDGKKEYVDRLIRLINSAKKSISAKTSTPTNVIVHTNSFKIAKHIAEYGKFNRDEYYFHLNEQVVNMHTALKPNCINKEEFMMEINSNPEQGYVFISPSITEGVDFKNGLARVQIILKHPMPNYGDPYISVLLGNIKVPGVDKDPDIYKRKTYTTLVQQYGRIMRSDNDWGITIIADEKCRMDIEYLLRSRDRKNANIEYLLEAIPTTLVNGKLVFKCPEFATIY